MVRLETLGRGSKTLLRHPEIVLEETGIGEPRISKGKFSEMETRFPFLDAGISASFTSPQLPAPL